MSVSGRGAVRNSKLSLVLVLSVPFVVLAIDFYFFPMIWNSRLYAASADITRVFAEQTMALGTYRAHHVFVSADDIRDPIYLSYLKDKPNALVITAFIEAQDNQTTAYGALQSAILSQLQVLSPADYLNVQNAFRKLQGFKEGQVLDIELHIPERNYKAL